MNKSTSLILIITAFILGAVAFSFIPKSSNSLRAVPTVSQVFTTSGGFTESTTSISTAPTQFVASTNQLTWLVNTSGAQITCSLDARNTTAASSSVTAGRGIIIPATSTGNLVPSAAFGACIPGVQNCYPHLGAVNCVAAATSTVDKIVQ